MNSEVCVLDDGQRVRFSLKKRERDPYYLVSFKGPDRGRKELSTREANKRRATDAAIVLIRDAFTPDAEPSKNPSWDEAIGVMTRQMRADNLRPKTIEQYLLVVKSLRTAFPETAGPADITPPMASRYKAIRHEKGVSVRTLRGNLENLGIVYGKWLVKECCLLGQNPFSEIRPPKEDKPTPRFLLPEEVSAFSRWLSGRWGGWRLPLLFLEVKGLVGCRITELASAPSDKLKDGRIVFEAATTKGRKQREVRLPPEIFDELSAAAGSTYVFEAFSDELRKLHTRRGDHHHATRVRGYSPERLKDWMENQAVIYFDGNPRARKFKLHNFRGTAITNAKRLGVSFEEAAVAFGCDPETMRQHYLALDEVAITDRVMAEIQNSNRGSDGGIPSRNDSQATPSAEPLGPGSGEI